MIMVVNDIWDGWDLSFLYICLTVEGKTPKKLQSGELTQPGIEPGLAK